jgi:hypothetical protein
MGGIYHNAHITISASFASTVKDSFLQKSPEISYAQVRNLSLQPGQWMLTHYIYGYSPVQDPLFKRAWTL